MARMATLSLSRLQQVVERFEEVEARMGATTETDEIIALSKLAASQAEFMRFVFSLLRTLSGLEYFAGTNAHHPHRTRHPDVSNDRLKNSCDNVTLFGNCFLITLDV